ncbi:MAG: MGMT family protein [Candidatus Aminicenantes bacterium]|nr:MGMT family protein [Candidatus Aminicenantes bacterium]
MQRTPIKFPIEDDDFSGKVKNWIKKIPAGKVATYGQISFLAGHFNGARQVSWILHSCSKKEHLPWHRVINQKGTISLKPGSGYEKQKQLLEAEGVVFNNRHRIDLDRFQWIPEEFNHFEF